MSDIAWLRAVDCSLLQSNAEDVDPLGQRLLQRLLELALFQHTTKARGSDALAKALLEEISAALRADQTTIWEAQPEGKARWSYLRRGGRPDPMSRQLLAEVLDREAGMSSGPAPGQPALVAACLSFTERPNRVLLVSRPREAFTKTELGYAIAAGHYLGLALEQGRAWDEARVKEERLEALVEIGRQMSQERETIPLLEHIAAKAAQLLRCERASIFLWDKARKELVGRPALGLPNGELRLPESTGVVGRVVQTGEAQIVDNVRADPGWDGAIDKASGFETDAGLV